MLVLTVKQLRKLIKEEVFRNLAWSAGFFGSGLNGASSNTSSGIATVPPGLGDEEENIENEEEKEQELEYLSQPGAAASSRKGGRYRTARDH